MGQAIRRYGLVLLLIVCFAVLLMGLAGCRYTDVIRETIYDQTADVVDEEAEPIVTFIPPEDNDEKEDIDQRQDEVEEKEDAEAQLETIVSLYGGSLDQGTTRSLIYDLSGVNFGSASATFAGGAASNTTDNNSSSSGNGAGNGPSGSGAGGGTGSGGGGGKTPVLNPGSYEDLPEDSYAIAAPGEYAEIVCALGGADALAASSPDFISAATDVSSSWSSVSKLDAVFTNAGTGKLRDGGLATLKSLHEKGKCDTVLLESTDAIDSSDLTSLRNAGIRVVAPVSLSSINQIESTVKAVGKLLTDKTGGSSVTKASDYSSLCTQVSNKCKDDSGLYTLYVTDWDSTATYKVAQAGTNGTIISGTGLAATTKSTTTSRFLASGGVTNTPSLSGFNSLSSTGLYWVNQFEIDVDDVSISAGGLSSVSMASKSKSSSQPYREFVLKYEGESSNGGGKDKPLALGESGFPAMIAADKDIAEELMQSRDKSKSAYTPYGRFDANKARNILGYKESEDNYIQTLIGDGSTTGSNCYKVYTAPHGIYSSWTDGSMESILLTAWANRKFYGSYSESELKDLVTDFYKDFYGNSNVSYNSIMTNAGE